MKIALIASALAGGVLCFCGLLPFGGTSTSAPADVQVLYYPNGREQARAELEDGVRHGAASEFYASGQTRCTGSYAHGLREGPWTFYAQDGSVDVERSGTYVAGVKADATLNAGL